VPGQVQLHFPPTQVLSFTPVYGTQSRPHWPQLCWSLCRFTHWPLHDVVPPVQHFVGSPFGQLEPLAHLQHVEVSSPGHLVPSGHLQPHTPPLQVARGSPVSCQQLWPHAPQFFGSLVTGMHPAPQSRWPLGQAQLAVDP
jgi:hypothetical protein